MNNEKTEFCWSCHQQKPTDQIDMRKGTFTSGICQSCKADLNSKLKDGNVTLVQKDRSPQYSEWHHEDVIIQDVSIVKDKETYFVRGFHTCESPYETAEVFNLVKRFVQNGFQWMKFYGNLETLGKHDFWFYIEKHKQFYSFGGNCFDISNAFSLKTLDLNQILKYIEVWTPIPERLKQNIKIQLDAGLVFASHPEHFAREKLFCFKKYSKETHTPKIMVLQGFNQIEKTA